jgi:hypothetical protein
MNLESQLFEQRFTDDDGAIISEISAKSTGATSLLGGDEVCLSLLLSSKYLNINVGTYQSKIS